MAFKQLGAIDINGTSHVINTLYPIYTVPANKTAIVSTILAQNRNSTTAKIRIYHLPAGQTLTDAHSITFDEPLHSLYGKGIYQFGITMVAGDIIYILSNKVWTNFILWGDEI